MGQAGMEKTFQQLDQLGPFMRKQPWGNDANPAVAPFWRLIQITRGAFKNPLSQLAPQANDVETSER